MPPRRSSPYHSKLPLLSQVHACDPIPPTYVILRLLVSPRSQQQLHSCGVTACRGLHVILSIPLTLFFAYLSAPAPNKSCAVAVWPLAEASMRAVLPYTFKHRGRHTHHSSKKKGEEGEKNIGYELRSSYHKCMHVILSPSHLRCSSPPCQPPLPTTAPQLRCDHCARPACDPVSLPLTSFLASLSAPAPNNSSTIAV